MLTPRVTRTLAESAKRSWAHPLCSRVLASGLVAPRRVRRQSGSPTRANESVRSGSWEVPHFHRRPVGACGRRFFSLVRPGSLSPSPPPAPLKPQQRGSAAYSVIGMSASGAGSGSGGAAESSATASASGSTATPTSAGRESGKRGMSTEAAGDAASLPHHDVAIDKREGAYGPYTIELAVFTPRLEQTSTVFLTHGLGDTAFGWVDAVVGFYSRALPQAKFILPTAPAQPVSLNMGMVMPSWYDLKGLSERDDEDCDGIELARNLMTTLFHEELAAGIPSTSIVFAGFSQGGAVALYSGLQLPHTLGGILVKSGYLPLSGSVAEAVTDEAKETPVQFLHGDSDPMVLPAWCEKSEAAVRAMGVKSVDKKVYAGLQHSASIEELIDATNWLAERLPDSVPFDA